MSGERPVQPGGARVGSPFATASSSGGGDGGAAGTSCRRSPCGDGGWGGALGHDIHFLERLERLPAKQVETALALYRDAGLVKGLLGDLGVPEGVDRVAISLADPVQGPFVIVTRAGDFVTCLGEGMSVGDKPVVTKERFDRVARQVGRVREMEEESEKYPKRTTNRLLMRLFTAGHRVSREHFLRVAAWAPLLGVELLRFYWDVATSLEDVYQALARQRRFSRRDESLLRLYWQHSWSLAHLSLLLGLDGGASIRRMTEKPELLEMAHGLSWPTTRFGLANIASRGLWLAGKIGKPLLPPHKAAFRKPGSPLVIVDAGLCLTAIGLANQRLRAEVGKLFAQSSVAGDDPFSKYVRLFYKFFSAHYQAALETLETKDETIARVASIQLPKMPGSTDADRAALSGMPPEVQIATLMAYPFDIMPSKVTSLQVFFLLLPWIARARAEDFYVPEAHLTSEPWEPKTSFMMLTPRREDDGLLKKSDPVSAPKLPGPNDPCSCGSGKKYKKCCRP